MIEGVLGFSISNHHELFCLMRDCDLNSPDAKAAILERIGEIFSGKPESDYGILGHARWVYNSGDHLGHHPMLFHTKVPINIQTNEPNHQFSIDTRGIFDLGDMQITQEEDRQVEFRWGWAFAFGSFWELRTKVNTNEKGWQYPNEITGGRVSAAELVGTHPEKHVTAFTARFLEQASQWRGAAEGKLNNARALESILDIARYF